MSLHERNSRPSRRHKHAGPCAHQDKGVTISSPKRQETPKSSRQREMQVHTNKTEDRGYDLHQPRNRREPKQHSKPTEGVSLRRLRPVLDVNRDRIQESVCPTIRLTTRSRGAQSLDMKMNDKVARHSRRTNLSQERW